MEEMIELEPDTYKSCDDCERSTETSEFYDERPKLVKPELVSLGSVEGESSKKNHNNEQYGDERISDEFKVKMEGNCIMEDVQLVDFNVKLELQDTEVDEMLNGNKNESCKNSLSEDRAETWDEYKVFDNCADDDAELQEAKPEMTGHILQPELVSAHKQTLQESVNCDLKISATRADKFKKGKYKCHLCKYATNRNSNLNRHVRLVHLTFKETCELCDYKPAWKGDLKRHLETVHLKFKNHKCDSCEFSAHQKNILLNHINAVHINLKNITCGFCDYRTSQKSYLKKHLNIVHFKLRSYKCEICNNYTAARKNDLKRHINGVHMNIRNYKCDSCKFTATQMSALKVHIDAVHVNLKTNICQFCDYTASNKFYLKRHLDVVHSNPKSYKCGVCNYSTNRKSDLNRHVNSFHLKVKEHTCNQ